MEINFFLRRARRASIPRPGGPKPPALSMLCYGSGVPLIIGAKYLSYMKVSSKVAGVEYAIRDIVLAAKHVERQGMQVEYLNVGDPPQYGFQPPQNVLDAYVDAIRRGYNYYAPSEGLPELRQEIAVREARKGLMTDAENVIVTNGISEALDMVTASIVEDGDEVLLPGPYYPPYSSYVKLHGGIPVEFAIDIATGRPDIDDMRRKITDRTVAVCLINPNNPTGMVLDRHALRDIVDTANEHQLYIICDEIYDQIVYDGNYTGIGSVAGDSPVVLLGGFSKVNLMTGWRLGYVVFGNSPLLEPLRRCLPQLARVRIAANLPAQYAAIESLRGPQGYIDEFVSELRRRRDLVVKRLDSMPNVSCPPIRGAFYAFPRILDNPYDDDYAFVMKLLQTQGVLVVHGSGFGKAYGSDHFRLVFLADLERLNSAMDRIENFVSSPPT